MSTTCTHNALTATAKVHVYAYVAMFAGLSMLVNYIHMCVPCDATCIGDAL